MVTQTAIHPATRLFCERQIADRVDTLAAEIAAALGREFLVVGLLTGAFVFVADLVRALSRHGARPRIELIGFKSYGDTMDSSGAPRLVGELPDDLGGRPVLLVDDVFDTGHTLAAAAALLRQRNAGPVSVCVLVEKRHRRAVPLALDFVGFSIDQGFVVGYGIDYAQQYRHLPYIGVLDRP